MRRTTAIILLLLTLQACAPKAATPSEPFGLDCGQTFEAQAAKLVAQPGLQASPPDLAEPYSYYSSADGRTSYLITRKGAPGHPAILIQRAAGGEVKTTGCPYGDHKGYAELLKYLDSLKTWRR